MGRLAGGLLFFAGMLLMAWNVFMTALPSKQPKPLTANATGEA
jgi:cbb3-type cytochrome oxidase subunit 1